VVTFLPLTYWTTSLIVSVKSMARATTVLSSGPQHWPTWPRRKKQLILEKLETNGTLSHQEAECERQACTGRNQSSLCNVCKTTLACTTLGSSAAMLTVVISVKTMEQSVTVACFDILHQTKAGQGTWKCGLPAEFIDAEQMSVQELVDSKKMPHATLHGNHHNESINMLSVVNWK